LEYDKTQSKNKGSQKVKLKMENEGLIWNVK
jgi:hypothetical protein